MLRPGPRRSTFGFPDAHDIVELHTWQAGVVTSLVTVAGTHRGQWLGFEPTGCFCRWSAVGIDRVENGRIVKRAAIFHLAEVMRQMAVLTLPI